MSRNSKPRRDQIMRGIKNRDEIVLRAVRVGGAARDRLGLDAKEYEWWAVWRAGVYLSEGRDEEGAIEGVMYDYYRRQVTSDYTV
jgi:hypothetical protein